MQKRSVIQGRKLEFEVPVVEVGQIMNGLVEVTRFKG